MSNVDETINSRAGGGLVRFVTPYSINIPELKDMVARGSGTLEEFVDLLMPPMRESILAGVKKAVEEGVQND